jgi:beta-galactosidase
MKIGVYYYPEQWPREQWRRDFDNMAKMGLQIAHMGEFAWYSMEPTEGNIQLDWLSECVEMASQRKMKVILCTPTAVPPVWLVEKDPDVCLKRADGSCHRHGGRRHGSPTSPGLRDATARIVTALAERFGEHPSVIGWQIDNELSGPFGQNHHTHESFRAWLQRKYVSIENLNKAWGNQFWNTFYTDFRQIHLPASRDPEYGNPHQHLDASRFWSWAYADFTKVQADLLRPKIGKDRWITTNFMPYHLDCDPNDFKEFMDLTTWDSYPVTGWDRHPHDETYRLAGPNSLGMVHDYMASYQQRWALMEIQPGQVNWSGIPVLLYPGAVRLWLWTAFAHGAEFITVYRYRQPLWGIEMFHHALVTTDGVTPSPGGRQFSQVIQEVSKLDLSRVPDLKDEKIDDNTVGIIFDFDQLWWYRTLPQAKRWSQTRFLEMWYGAIARLGLRVKVLRPDQDWPSDLKLIVAPGLQMVDERLVKKMDRYVSEGGNLILTCRTALMDRTGQMFEGPTAAPIVDLIGANIEAYDGLPEGSFGHIEMDAKKYRWGVWGDLLFAHENTRVLAKYADQFYEGAIAVTQKRHGKGLVTYCGVHAEHEFIEALIERITRELEIETAVLPDRVHVIRRGAYRILLNYRDQPVTAPAPKGAKFVVGGRKVEPAGVAVWEE